MAWTPPEVAQSMKSSVQDSGWVPPEVKKKEEPVSLGGSESLASPSVATEDNKVIAEIAAPKPPSPTMKEMGGSETSKALKSSSARALGGIIGLPNFISENIDNFVLKPILKGVGYSDEEANAIAMATKAAPISGGANVIQSKQGQQELNKYASSVESTMKQYDNGIVESIYNKNYADAGAQIWKGAVQSLPYLVMTAATSGGGTAAVLTTIGTTAAAQRYGEVTDPTSEEGKTLSETGKIANSWAYGGFEAAGELVTAGLLNTMKKAVGQIGEEAAKEIGKGFAKEAAKNFALEGSSEAMTELGQQATDYLQGLRDNIDFKAVADAAVIGGVTGAGIAGTTATANKTAKMLAGRKVASEADVDKVNENNAKIVDLLAEKEKAVTPEAESVIDTQLSEVAKENKDIIDSNEQKAEKLSPEEIVKLKDLDDAIASYDARIESPSETDNPELLKQIKDKLVLDKQKLVEQATTKKQEPVVVEETKQVEIKPTETISESVEPRSAEEALVVPSETKVAKKQQKEVVVEPEVSFPKPPKQVKDLSSKEIRQFSDDVKKFEDDLVDNVFGDNADEYKRLERISNSSTRPYNQVKEADDVMEKMIESLPKSKQDLWNSEATHDWRDLRETSRLVEYVEQAEGIEDLSSSLKKPLMTFKKDRNNEQSLAIFNAATKRTQELGISPKDLIAKTASKIAREFPDPQDAMDVVKSALEAISQPTVVEQKQIGQKQPIVGEQTESEATDTEINKTAKAVSVKPQNLRGVYKAGREVLGLNKIQALAQAVVFDRVVGQIAKRRSATKEQVYSEIEFKKADKLIGSKENTYFQAAWHGSPYQFDKFTTEKIGTGEGNMQFGWGLYFTSLKDIAEGYGNLAFRNTDNSPKKLRGNDGFLYFVSMTPRGAVYYKENRDTYITTKISKEIFEKKIKGIGRADRILYKVNIVEGDGLWIDYSERLGDELLKIIGDRYGVSTSDTGWTAYKKIASAIGGMKEASVLLLNMGVNGIKYPAESIARGATSDNARGFNYVVFDENAITIEEVIKFQKDLNKNKGAVTLTDSKATIYALTDPDVSTPLHELAHIYEKYMTDVEKANVLKWTKEKAWSVETSEKFARGFEKYLSEGVAPTNDLQRVFDRFKTWLTDIYNGIKGSEIDIELNKKMRDIYSQMLGVEVKQTKKEQDEKDVSKGGEETIQGRQENVLVEAKRKLEREVKKEENKARLGRIFDNAAKLTGARLDITSEEKRTIRKELARDVVDYVKTEFDLLGEALVEKVKSFVKDNSIPLEDFSDQELNDVLKEQGYAEKDGGIPKEGSQQAQRVVEGTEGQVRVRDDEKNRMEAGKREKVKAEKSSTTGKYVVKVGRFETRLTLDDTKLPQSVKEQIKERGIGEFVSMSDEQSYDLARKIAESSTIDEITQMSLSSDVHPMVRVGLMLEANKIFNKEVMLAEKEGRTADAQKWSDQQIDYYEEYAQLNSRNAALLLRGLGTAAALETFAPFTHVAKYKRDTAAERQKLQSTDTHKKSLKKVQKAAKKAYDDAVDGAIKDPKVQKIIDANKDKPLTPVKPDRLVELKKKEKALIEKLKKSFRGTLTSGGLTKEGIEALGELAIVYIEEAGYHVGKAVKKLIKTAKSVGFTLTEEEALGYMPDKIDGKPIKEKQAEEETAKAAEKLANKIFGEVVATKPKEDPLLLMVNTLLGKFKERDLGKERKKPATDIERIADAIQNKETYSGVWKEARDLAVSKIEGNELLGDTQKEDAAKRVEDAYQRATSFTFTEAQVDRAIKRKMAELGVRVSDVVKEFYDIQSAERGKLSDALIEEAGLSKEQAKLLAEAIERRFDTMLSEGKKKIVDKYIGKIKEGASDAEKTQAKQRKTKTAELLELINIGAFESAEFREAYATAVGIPEFSAENAAIIRKLGEEIQRQKEPLQKHKKIQDLLGFIKLLGGISPSDMALSIWYANTLSGIKTQERNIVGGTSGVTLRLLSDMLVSGRPMATARGYINGITSGWTKAMDAWKDGYAPFSSRVEIPSTAEVFQMKRGLFKPIWNSIKYVGRTMNALDLLNAETGKEAFATVLANEALKVDRWKALTDPKYAKEQRELVKKYLVTDKETVDRLKKEIEDDAAEFGYSELDKRMILLDKINRLRPTETTEQAARFGVYSTGNVDSFGTVGFLSDKIAEALKWIKIKYYEPKTGREKIIAPLSLFAAFTKIAGNVGEMSLNYVPPVGLYRVYAGGYGSAFKITSANGASPYTKYAVELTPREKKTIIGQQILGTVAMVGLYLMTQPDDEGESTIRITANGTGDFRANKNLTDWQEYSIGITDEKGKTTWISYKNTPLILPFSVLGFMRDSQRYKKEYKDVDDLDLFTKGIQGMPAFLGDMSAIGSMTKVFDNLINVGSGKSTQSIPDNLLNTVKNFYTPAIYRDAVDIMEQMWDVNVEAKVKGTSFFDIEAKKRQMFGRNPISVIKKIIDKEEVIEAIDVYGRPTERLMPLDIIIKRDSEPTDVDKLALYHQKYANVPVEPNVSQTLFKALDPKSQEYVDVVLIQSDKRQQLLWHTYIKRRGELILEAISDNMDLKGEEYIEAIEPAIREATKKARAEIEEELMANPLKDIEERQLKK